MRHSTGHIADADAETERHGPPRGAFYVGARVTDAGESARSGAVTRPCVHCGTDVLVDAGDVALAESCAAVACSHCTGTAEGILYIAP